MATPPFDPDETKPAPSDLISQYPTVEQAFRDVIESWMLIDHNRDGQHDQVTLEDQEGSEPSGTADHITLFNDDGVLSFRVGTGSIQTILDKATADAAYLALTGGTLTGTLTIKSASPSLALEDTDDSKVSKITQNSGQFLLDAADTSTPVRIRVNGGGSVSAFTVVKGGGNHEIYSRFDKATQAQAETGTNNDAVMTPLRTKQAIDSKTKSIGANGHTELPGGVIMQWGRVARSSADQTISFPRTFPNAVFSITVTAESDTDQNIDQEANIGSTRSTSQFNVRNAEGDVSHYNWFAVGN